MVGARHGVPADARGKRASALCCPAQLPPVPPRGTDPLPPPCRLPAALPQVDMRVLASGFDEGADILEFEHWN